MKELFLLLLLLLKLFKAKPELFDFMSERDGYYHLNWLV